MSQHGPARQPAEASAESGRVCPWCRGQLVLRTAFPVTGLIPGGFRSRGDADVPESLRTTSAWVCTTAHCKYREQAF